MIMRIRWALLSIIFIASVALSGYKSFAKGVDSQYFPETGHYVSDEFLDKYRSASDPLKVYGYPITDAFSRGTFEYQYFEKTLFIRDPNASLERRIRLAPLGDLLYERDTAPSISPNTLGCQDFPDSGYPFRVCYAFLDFFNEHGGVSQLGYPISKFEKRDNMIVQYFQLARLEWHPELPASQMVRVSDLGVEYFKEQNEDRQLLLANLDDNIPRSILTLSVRPFPVYAVLPRVSMQTLNVLVRDQNNRPVSSAKVNMIVSFPSGEKIFHDMAVTNEQGIASVTFKVESQTTGVAQIQVTTIHENIVEQSVTSFHIWW